ncbi:MAG: hypothetical protein ABIP85_05920 [Chthoniobacteraceae bacterium]
MTPQPVLPNPDRRGKRGVTFAKPPRASPACNPSRTTSFSGLRSSITGLCENDHDATPAGLH